MYANRSRGPSTRALRGPAVLGGIIAVNSQLMSQYLPAFEPIISVPHDDIALRFNMEAVFRIKIEKTEFLLLYLMTPWVS